MSPHNPAGNRRPGPGWPATGSNAFGSAPPSGPDLSAAQRWADQSAMRTAAFARSVVNGERYLSALRANEASYRAAWNHAARAARPDVLQLHSDRSVENHLRYVSHLRTHPAYMFRQGAPIHAPTGYELLQAHVMSMNPGPIGLMMTFDPVVRSVAGTAAVAAAGTASVALVEAHIAALSTGTAVKAIGAKILVNATGQFAGNYLYSHDALYSAQKINGVSVLAAAYGIPLGANSLLSAGATLNFADGFKTVLGGPGGSITTFEFGRDAAFNYGFGKLAAGFKFPAKMPALGGRTWVGLDKLHQTMTASNGVGFAAYQGMLRLGPRIGYGLGLGLSTGLEHGNKIASGAAKKYLSNELKEHVPGKK